MYLEGLRVPQKELEKYTVNSKRGTINEVVGGKVVLRLRFDRATQWADGASAAILGRHPITIDFEESYPGVDGVMEGAITRLSLNKHPE